MAVRTTSRRRNISRVPERIPVEETNLTAKERARLKDPNWVTEDEADAIVAMREIRKGGKTYSLDQVLKENGLTLERSNPRRRPSAASPARALALASPSSALLGVTTTTKTAQQECS